MPKLLHFINFHANFWHLEVSNSEYSFVHRLQGSVLESSIFRLFWFDFVHSFGAARTMVWARAAGAETARRAEKAGGRAETQSAHRNQRADVGNLRRNPDKDRRRHYPDSPEVLEYDNAPRFIHSVICFWENLHKIDSETSKIYTWTSENWMFSRSQMICSVKFFIQNLYNRF